MMVQRYTKTASLLFLSLVLLMSPGEALAQYLSPEEVLFGGETFLPPSRREVEERVKEQQRRSTLRRESEQEEIFGIQEEEEESTEGGLEEQVSSLEEAIETLLEQESTARERQEERLLQRVEAQQALLEAPAPAEAARGGIPLIGTGLESVIALITLVVAGAWTLLRARYRVGN